LEVPREFHGAIAVGEIPLEAVPALVAPRRRWIPGCRRAVAAGQRDAGAVVAAGGQLGGCASDPIGAVICRYSGDTHAEVWIPITAQAA
jgi:hypothetical protein